MPATQLPARPTHQALYSGRFVLAYKWAALAVVGLTLFWSLFFGLQGNWVLSLSQAAVAALGLISWAMARSGRLAASLLVSQGIFFLFIVWLCLVFDVPSAAAPRVCHLFLLVMALLGYLNYKRDGSRAQLAIVGACMLGFAALSSTTYALPFAHPIDDGVRLYGAWLNTVVAMVLLVGGFIVLQMQLEQTGKARREIKAALWARQFELFYQPQVDRSGAVIGAETLLRWKHPKRGYVSPLEFIPLAEEAGLMGELGQWVLETACRTLADWQQDPVRRAYTLSVNVSASQFLDEDFEHLVVNMVELFGIDPRLLKLEITESVMMSNIDVVAARMQVLRSIGIGMALDDFGTGYSSLGYLRRLPLTQLKIDRSFVQDVIESERSASLARSIVQLGRDLELSVLAEGVETAEQFAFLKGCGCDEFQGFYFSRPVPRGDFESATLRAAA